MGEDHLGFPRFFVEAPDRAVLCSKRATIMPKKELPIQLKAHFPAAVALGTSPEFMADCDQLDEALKEGKEITDEVAQALIAKYAGYIKMAYRIIGLIQEQCDAIDGEAETDDGKSE